MERRTWRGWCPPGRLGSKNRCRSGRGRPVHRPEPLPRRRPATRRPLVWRTSCIVGGSSWEPKLNTNFTKIFYFTRTNRREQQPQTKWRVHSREERSSRFSSRSVGMESRQYVALLSFWCNSLQSNGHWANVNTGHVACGGQLRLVG